MEIGETYDPDFPGGRALTISIFLSVFNLHVNRVPLAGRVTALRYYPGEFLEARDADCSVRDDILDRPYRCTHRRPGSHQVDHRRHRSPHRLLAAAG